MKTRVVDGSGLREPSPTFNGDQSDDVPEGWTITTFGEACLLNPLKPTPDILPPGGLVSFVPMPAVDADLGSIVSATERPYSEVRNAYTVFADRDVIMAKITPCMENGKAAIADGLTNGLAAGSTEFHVLRPTGAAVSEYLFHFIRQPSFRRLAGHHMTGTAGQRRVPASFLDSAELPLPPLAEQRRIAEAVEALMARVDAARARLDRAPAILKRFRQAVLAAACSGRLTEDWRAMYAPYSSDSTEDGKALPAGWSQYCGVDFYVDARYGTSVKCDRLASTGVPVLRIPNIASGRVSFEDLKYGPVVGRDLDVLRLRKGDIVVCRTNGSLDLVGKAAVVPALAGDFAFASYLIRLRLDAARLLPEYLHVCLSSVIGRDHIEKTARTTAGQFNLNLEILRSLPVPYPPPDEQHEIVRRVEALFALADAIERRLAVARAQADRLPQAILARAFSGRLVPTETELARREGRDYEPASVLLERIRSERAARPAARLRRRRAPG